MSARVLGSYCAIVPDNQTTGAQKNGSVYVVGDKVFSRYLSGVVVSVGSKCHEAVKVGDRVLYERLSGHPGQTGPIDASVFGGEEGKFCVIIPVYSKSLKSASELDEEIDKRNADVMLIEQRHRSGLMTDDDSDAMDRHERRMKQIKEERSNLGRGSKLGKIYDRARGAGVVAIIGD